MGQLGTQNGTGAKQEKSIDEMTLNELRDYAKQQNQRIDALTARLDSLLAALEEKGLPNGAAKAGGNGTSATGTGASGGSGPNGGNPGTDGADSYANDPEFIKSQVNIQFSGLMSSASIADKSEIENMKLRVCSMQLDPAKKEQAKALAKRAEGIRSTSDPLFAELRRDIYSQNGENVPAMGESYMAGYSQNAGFLDTKFLKDKIDSSFQNLLTAYQGKESETSTIGKLRTRVEDIIDGISAGQDARKRNQDIQAVDNLLGMIAGLRRMDEDNFNVVTAEIDRLSRLYVRLNKDKNTIILDDSGTRVRTSKDTLGYGGNMDKINAANVKLNGDSSYDVTPDGQITVIDPISGAQRQVQMTPGLQYELDALRLKKKKVGVESRGLDVKRGEFDNKRRQQPLDFFQKATSTITAIGKNTRGALGEVRKILSFKF